MCTLDRHWFVGRGGHFLFSNLKRGNSSSEGKSHQFLHPLQSQQTRLQTVLSVREVTLNFPPNHRRKNTVLWKRLTPKHFLGSFVERLHKEEKDKASLHSENTLFLNCSSKNVTLELTGLPLISSAGMFLGLSVAAAATTMRNTWRAAAPAACWINPTTTVWWLLQSAGTALWRKESSATAALWR